MLVFNIVNGGLTKSENVLKRNFCQTGVINSGAWGKLPAESIFVMWFQAGQSRFQACRKKKQIKASIVGKAIARIRMRQSFFLLQVKVFGWPPVLVLLIYISLPHEYWSVNMALGSYRVTAKMASILSWTNKHGKIIKKKAVFSLNMPC